MEDNDLDDFELYIPVKIPKVKYVMGIEGLYSKEATIIGITMVIAFIFSYFYFGDLMKYSLHVIGIIAVSGIASFSLLIRTPMTNTSIIGYFIKLIQFLKSEKKYIYKYNSPLKGGNHHKKKNEK